MNTLISICIPTYQRPDLLREAIESCLAQTYEDIEIVVCDDSKDNVSEIMVQGLAARVPIRYYRNTPSLGQAGNVNRLFQLAHGDKIVLLHDDDLLLPDAVEKLARCWEMDPGITVSFGKQQLVNAQGQLFERGSEEINAAYHRLPEHAGRQSSSVWSALVAQFPNDGYMVLSKAAKTVLYRDLPQVGPACDYDFGLRLASQCDGFYFLDEWTAKYRLTDVSVSHTSNYANLTYDLIEAFPLPADLEPVRTEQLRRHASPAISRWLRLGDKRAALRIFRSKYFPPARRLTPKGIAYGLMLVCPDEILQWFFRA